jgi:DNA polymerase III delta prime subunit
MENKLQNLLLHPKTRLQIEYLFKNPPQALLIAANAGSGKSTLAKEISAQLLKLKSSEQLLSYQYFFHITRLKNKQDISIDQIRAVIAKLKLKAPGTNRIRRIVFIEGANYLSIPAQNALLKILEEPSSDTLFILTTNSVLSVLPTIASRTQKMEILPIGLNDAVELWNSSYQKPAIESAWKLSGGSVGLLSALLSNDKDHPLKLAVNDAKNFISSSKYERILYADNLSRDKENFCLFLDAMSRTLNFLNHGAIKSSKDVQAKKLLFSRKLIKESLNALESNANARLVALKFVLSLKI